MNQDILARALDTLADLTPLVTDCGQLCNRACCAGDFTCENGMFLFPGERGALENAPWASISQTPFRFGGEPTLLIKCAGVCERRTRPLACRLFPLTPYRANADKKWRVRLDRRAWAVCPLMRYGLRGLNPAFVKAARTCVRILAEDPENERFLEDWQLFEESFSISL